MQNLFNVNQVAFMLKVHPLTIRRYLREGKLKAVRVGGCVRIAENDLQQATKEFSPHPKNIHKSSERKIGDTKIFNIEDPMLYMEGRGASIHLHEIKT